MPKLPPKACRKPGCPGLAREGAYCPAHTAHNERQRDKRHDESRPSASKRGYDRTHRKLRKLVMAEQPICAAEGCDEPGWEMDHKNGDARDRRRENLQMLCKTHHSQKTIREQGGFGRERAGEHAARPRGA